VDGLTIDKLDENDLAVYRRNKVGFIFQSFNLISSLNALDNVAFPMRFCGISTAQRHNTRSGIVAADGIGKTHGA
jgi:putative ABC transport system ATP-binding protein